MATKKTNNSTTSLRENEVYDVLEFANNYYKTAQGLNNVFTPELVNQKLQQVTMNPLQAKEDIIQKSLLDPINNEQNLIGMMEYFELTDMLVKRTMGYLSNILSFDFTCSCCNIEKRSDYHSEEYKKDYNQVKEFFNKFDVKQQFTYVMKQMLRQETGYYFFRTDGLKYQLQDLPQKYCKLTGKWDYGFLFDFNMYWFLLPGVDINMYPKIMKKMYNEVFWDTNQNYKPSNPLNNRDGTWTYWSQTSPLEGFWAFKLNADRYSNVPFLASMFPEAVLRPLVRKLQTNQYIISAQKVMVGIIPYLKDVKGAVVKDQFAISPEAMGKFLGLLKQGLSDVIKVGGVPFEDVKILDFKPNDKDMFDEYSKTTAGGMGVTSRLIYASDKMSASELETSKEIDEMLMLNIYPYFEDFLNYQVNTFTKKFKFKFKFEGTNFAINKKERFDQWHKNAALGIVNVPKLASAMGLTQFELEAQLEMSKECGFVDNLVSLMNLNTGIDGTSNEKGRPKSNLDNASESTERKDSFNPSE